MNLFPMTCAGLALIVSCAMASAQLPVPPSPGPPPSGEMINELASQLSSDQFRTRENAQIELTRLAVEYPDETLEPLRKKYLASSDPEARFRLRGVLYRAKQAEMMKEPRGFVGIVMNPSLVRDPAGKIFPSIQIMRVVENSAAEKFGLRQLDQIINIDGRQLSSEDFSSYVNSKAAGDEIELTVQRNGVERKLKMTLGQRPPDLIDPRMQERLDSEFENWLDESKAGRRENK